MPNLAVNAQNLTKTFPPRSGWRRVQKEGAGTQAVRGVDLQVEEGELFGLLGPNGAGKTTLVKMLCTLVVPSAGQATVAGYDLRDEAAIRAAVGLVVTDERSFFWRLSARRNLIFYAAMYGMFGREAAQRVDEVLDAVQLSDRADSRFSDFSTGMKQRVAIARGLLHRPKILFLDEPSRSLDPTSTNNLHDLILDIQSRRNMTVFLITHDLNEAEKLCGRVAVMDQGMVRGVGSSADLRRQIQPTRQFRVQVDQWQDGLAEGIGRHTTDLTISHDLLQFTIPEDGAELTPILDILRENGVRITNIESEQPTLDDVFLQLTE